MPLGPAMVGIPMIPKAEREGQTLVPGAMVIQRRRGSQTRDKAEDEGPPTSLLLLC